MVNDVAIKKLLQITQRLKLCTSDLRRILKDYSTSHSNYCSQNVFV